MLPFKLVYLLCLFKTAEVILPLLFANDDDEEVVNFVDVSVIMIRATVRSTTNTKSDSARKNAGRVD